MEAKRAAEEGDALPLNCPNCQGSHRHSASIPSGWLANPEGPASSASTLACSG